jgi:hypothetical protein
MRRRIQGLHAADQSLAAEVPDGLFLVRVDRAQYRWQCKKPYYLIRLAVLEPHPLAGHTITGRVYCTQKALWKLTWFLRDFGYDMELLGQDEIEETSLVGLRGIIKISQNQPYRHERRFVTQIRRLRPGQPMGKTRDW